MCRLQECQQILLPWLAKYEPVRAQCRAQLDCRRTLTAQRECGDITPNLEFSIPIEHPVRDQVVLTILSVRTSNQEKPLPRIGTRFHTIQRGEA